MVESFSLQGVLTMDASDYVSDADKVSESNVQMSDSADSTSDSLVQLNEAGAAAGAGMVAAGTAMQNALDSTRKTRTALDRMAVSTDATGEELEQLTKDVTDVSLSHQQAVTAMDSFVSLGAESKSEIKSLTNSTKELANATGTSASMVAKELAPSIKGLDGNLSAIKSNADAFTLAVEESSLTMDGLSQSMQELNFEKLDKMGLKSEEVAGLMSKFADETGFTGEKLETNFSQAVEKADGDVEKLGEELGLGEDAVSEWNKTVEKSSGITEKKSQADRENASAMDKLRAKYADLKLQAAGFLQPISAIAPAMQAAGGATTFLSTVNVSALAPSLATVQAAMGPLLPVLLAITAAVGALAIAYKKDIGPVRDITQAVFGAAKTVIEGFAAIIPGIITDPIGTIKDVFKNFSIQDALQKAIDKAIDIFMTWHPVGIVISKRDEIIDAVQELPDMMKSVFNTAVNKAIDIFMTWHPVGIIISKRKEIISALKKLPGKVRDVFVNAAGKAIDVWQKWSPTAVLIRKRGAIFDVVSSIPGELKSLAVDSVKGFISPVKSFNPVSEFNRIKDQMMGALPQPEDFREAAAGLIDALVEGIKDNADAVKEAINDVTGGIADRLPGSDAETGPLSELTDMGRALPETFAKGADDNRDEVTRVSSEMAEDAAPEISASESGSNDTGGSPNVEFKFTGGSDVERMLWDLLKDNVDVLVDDKLADEFEGRTRV